MSDERTIPPKVDEAIVALADVILVSRAGVHSAEDIANAIRNVVSAVRDQVVEEMTEQRETVIHHSAVLAGDIVVWENQVYRVVNIALVEHGREYRLMFPGQESRERDKLVVISSVWHTDLQFRLLQSCPLRPENGETLGGGK